MIPKRKAMPRGVWMCEKCHTTATKHDIHISRMVTLRRPDTCLECDIRSIADGAIDGPVRTCSDCALFFHSTCLRRFQKFSKAQSEASTIKCRTCEPVKSRKRKLSSAEIEEEENPRKKSSKAADPSPKKSPPARKPPTNREARSKTRAAPRRQPASEITPASDDEIQAESPQNAKSKPSPSRAWAPTDPEEIADRLRNDQLEEQKSDGAVQPSEKEKFVWSHQAQSKPTENGNGAAILPTAMEVDKPVNGTPASVKNSGDATPKVSAKDDQDSNATVSPADKNANVPANMSDADADSIAKDADHDGTVDNDVLIVKKPVEMDTKDDQSDVPASADDAEPSPQAQTSASVHKDEDVAKDSVMHLVSSAAVESTANGAVSEPISPAAANVSPTTEGESDAIATAMTVTPVKGSESDVIAESADPSPIQNNDPSSVVVSDEAIPVDVDAMNNGSADEAGTGERLDVAESVEEVGEVVSAGKPETVSSVKVMAEEVVEVQAKEEEVMSDDAADSPKPQAAEEIQTGTAVDNVVSELVKNELSKVPSDDEVDVKAVKMPDVEVADLREGEEPISKEQESGADATAGEMDGREAAGLDVDVDHQDDGEEFTFVATPEMMGSRGVEDAINVERDVAGRDMAAPMDTEMGMVQENSREGSDVRGTGLGPEAGSGSDVIDTRSGGEVMADILNEWDREGNEMDEREGVTAEAGEDVEIANTEKSPQAEKVDLRRDNGVASMKPAETKEAVLEEEIAVPASQVLGMSDTGVTTATDMGVKVKDSRSGLASAHEVVADVAAGSEPAIEVTTVEDEVDTALEQDIEAAMAETPVRDTEVVSLDEDVGEAGLGDASQATKDTGNDDEVGDIDVDMAAAAASTIDDKPDPNGAMVGVGEDVGVKDSQDSRSDEAGLKNSQNSRSEEGILKASQDSRSGDAASVGVGFEEAAAKIADKVSMTMNDDAIELSDDDLRRSEGGHDSVKNDTKELEEVDGRRDERNNWGYERRREVMGAVDHDTGSKDASVGARDEVEEVDENASNVAVLGEGSTGDRAVDVDLSDRGTRDDEGDVFGGPLDAEPRSQAEHEGDRRGMGVDMAQRVSADRDATLVVDSREEKDMDEDVDMVESPRPETTVRGGEEIVNVSDGEVANDGRMERRRSGIEVIDLEEENSHARSGMANSHNVGEGDAMDVDMIGIGGNVESGKTEIGRESVLQNVEGD